MIDMTPKQIQAAEALRNALMMCKRAGLGVYIWDGTPMVCPQPEGREDVMWDDKPAALCTAIPVKGLDCDGGAGS